VIEHEGRRVEDRVRGRQARMLFGYLTLNRHRSCSRGELAGALWGDAVPEAGGADLNALISKLRRALGHGAIEGRTSLRLLLGEEAWVDVEVAEQAVHRAESRVVLRDWRHAWGPALSALFITERLLLPDDEADWIDERRASLGEIHLRALEAYAAAALGTGGTELNAAVRAGRRLVRAAPLRENGYQILMHALAAQGNVGEALLVHADLSRLLREELGVAPSAATQAVHQELLRG
jgi:DNA-binding SARP family transcriptional activator